MSLELKHVSHIYQEGSAKESYALRDICLNVNEGEFLGIAGHTGSGKSTLIQHFNGLLKPTSGEVIVDGVNINGKEAKKELKALRMQVGIVFQYPEYQLFEETVERDIAFGPRNLNLSDIEIQHRVTEAMDMLKLSKKLRKKSPFELSGGQKRKIAIAGVLAMKPKYLILDEPTAGLDPKGREEFLELIADLHQQGLTVVMVSHSMDDIARYAQRMIVLEHGEIRLEGTPQAVFAQSELLDQIGLGVPTLTRLLIELQKQGWDVRTDLFHPTDVSQEILRALSKREQRKGADLC
ncbi:MAG: energy-coupling factor transporter ATPase [Agathobacter sp.]|nr:energy-coupling factor transporter ATPase [Agathobacter sp.]MBO5365111.1 energy-coupling factor transporter ATPase [Peptococcaceae bacterium]MBP3584300.1 energy-coupling factor transporter ATPase [Peptococcaceae bacterium]